MLAKTKLFSARREAGYPIGQVQQGFDPSDWKPITSLGAGIREIRIHEAGEHRVLYIAKFEEAVYLLHAFRKKTLKTTAQDIDPAKKRYQALVNARKRR